MEEGDGAGNELRTHASIWDRSRSSLSYPRTSSFTGAWAPGESSKETTMKVKWLIAAAFALPLAAQAEGSSSASASGGHASASTSTDASATFKALDKNKDGYLSRDEAKGSIYEKNFDKLDKNSDGKLSRNEQQAAHQAQASSGGSAAAASSAPAAGQAQ